MRSGAAVRIPRNGPSWFTRMTSRNVSVLVSRSDPTRRMPALLTSNSRWPSRARIPSTVARHESSSVTSRCTYRAPSPRVAAASSPGSLSTSPSTTRAPSATKRRAVASPTPRAAPVISATLPSSAFMASLGADRAEDVEVRGAARREPSREEPGGGGEDDEQHELEDGDRQPDPLVPDRLHDRRAEPATDDQTQQRPEHADDDRFTADHASELHAC